MTKYVTKLEANGEEYFVKDSSAYHGTPTDEKVVQTASTTDAYYPILMSESASPTSGAAAEAKYSTDATFNPNVNTFRIRVPNDIDPTKYESMFLRSGGIVFGNEYTGEHVQMMPQNIMIDVDGDSFVLIRKDQINIDTKGTDVRYQTDMLGADIKLTESIATQADPFGPVHYRSHHGPTSITFIEYDTAHQDHDKIYQTTLNTAGLCIIRNDASDPTINLATINVDYNGIYNSLWTASKFVKTNANKMLVTADLTSTDVTTALGYTPSSTDTHVNVTGDTSTTKYLLGTSVTPSSTVQNVVSVSDTSIKVNETVRSIGYKINVDANYAMICGMGIAKSANIGASDTNSNMNMWIRAMGSNPIIGFRCSGSSQIWYFQATATALYLGPTSSSALWMQSNGRAGIPNGFYVGASNSTTSACRLTYDTTNGGMLQLYTGNNSTKKIELKGIDGTASFASTVTVGNLVDSGLTASKWVATDANKQLISVDAPALSDEKVKQTENTSIQNEYPILASAQTAPVSGTAYEAIYNTQVKLLPGAGELRIYPSNISGNYSTSVFGNSYYNINQFDVNESYREYICNSTAQEMSLTHYASSGGQDYTNNCVITAYGITTNQKDSHRQYVAYTGEYNSNCIILQHNVDNNQSNNYDFRSYQSADGSIFVHRDTSTQEIDNRIAFGYSSTDGFEFNMFNGLTISDGNLPYNLTNIDCGFLGCVTFSDPTDLENSVTNSCELSSYGIYCNDNTNDTTIDITANAITLYDNANSKQFTITADGINTKLTPQQVQENTSTMTIDMAYNNYYYNFYSGGRGSINAVTVSNILTGNLGNKVYFKLLNTQPSITWTVTISGTNLKGGGSITVPANSLVECSVIVTYGNSNSVAWGVLTHSDAISI